MFALVDGNNFYCSCERVFNPKLYKKPMVVLSNNDGCVISRSNEAKALGIRMGVPYFKARHYLERKHIHVLSSNYTLYGDMSARVMFTLAHFSPEVEQYSIDECFLDLSHIPTEDLATYGSLICQTVQQYTGIPCGIGIGPTKTLAKAANYFSKKTQGGVYVISDEGTRVDILKDLEVSKIWGIGKQYACKLEGLGIVNAYELACKPYEWARKCLGGVIGEQLIYELNGVACLGVEQVRSPKQSIAATRSFGRPVMDIEEMTEAVATHMFRAARKLRQDGSVARVVSVFMHNSHHQSDAPYCKAWRTYALDVATADTRKLTTAVTRLVPEMFQLNVRYVKCGVILSDICSADTVQASLFEQTDSPKSRLLMGTLDCINKKFGRQTVFLGAKGVTEAWKMQSNRKSNNYTTQWNELAKVY